MTKDGSRPSVSCLNFEPWSRNFLIIVADVLAAIMHATIRKSFTHATMGSLSPFFRKEK